MQVIYIIFSSIEETKQKYYKPEYICKFEGKYVENKIWFNLYFDWIETNLIPENQNYI